MKRYEDTEEVVQQTLNKQNKQFVFRPSSIISAKIALYYIYFRTKFRTTLLQSSRSDFNTSLIQVDEVSILLFKVADVPSIS